MLPNLIIRDFKDIVYPNCPRCGGKWENTEKYIVCERGCGIIAIPFSHFNQCNISLELHDDSTNVLFPEIYYVFWNDDCCMVSKASSINDFGEDMNEIELPLLPFDITLTQLKIYMLLL